MAKELIDHEHIGYDIGMMGMAVYSWARGGGIQTAADINIFTIVGFNCAANLLDLMSQEIDHPPEIHKLRRLIEEQIRSLTPKRTAVMEDKLALSEMKQLFAYIYDHASQIGYTPQGDIHLVREVCDQ